LGNNKIPKENNAEAQMTGMEILAEISYDFL
jgi:hypothetical protein